VPSGTRSVVRPVLQLLRRDRYYTHTIRPSLYMDGSQQFYRSNSSTNGQEGFKAKSHRRDSLDQYIGRRLRCFAFFACELDSSTTLLIGSHLEMVQSYLKHGKQKIDNSAFQFF
jgi:hypothetical protein